MCGVFGIVYVYLVDGEVFGDVCLVVDCVEYLVMFMCLIGCVDCYLWFFM